MATKASECQRMITNHIERTTNVNEEQRILTNGYKNHEWQRMTNNDEEWQRIMKHDYDLQEVTRNENE